MSDKYKTKKGQTLKIKKGFDEYPNWALFTDENGEEHALAFDTLETVSEDKDDEEG